MKRSDRLALEQLLAAAIDTGEIIRIVYHGGSRPGSVREVRPVAVMADELRARDIVAGIDKTFLLAKIEITEAPVTAAGVGAQSVAEAIAPRVPELQALGWHVELTTNLATLHAFTKNGKPRKSAQVSLWFEEYTGIFVVDENADGNPVEREERWKSRAPYHVSSIRLATRSFANLLKAAAVFLEEARNASTHTGKSKEERE